jgi:hypothetical protein
VGDEGVVSGLAEPYLEDAPTPYGDVNGLDADQRGYLRPVLVDALEYSTYHMEGADSVRAGVHHVEPEQLVRTDL